VKLNPLFPLHRADRLWQSECLTAIEAVFAAGGRQFLACVTPSGGKTRFGAEWARRLLVNGVIDAVVVLAPSDNIRAGWVEEAANFGMDLSGAVDASVVVRGFPSYDDGSKIHGCVVTYQWLSQNGDLLAQLVKSRRVLLLADEAHHTSNENSWGVALRQSLMDAAFRLALTGTPFRTDDAQIPLLDYDKNGVGEAHYEYSYGRALRDGVVAPVHFRWNSGIFEQLQSDGSKKVVDLDTLVHSDQETLNGLLTDITQHGSAFVYELLDRAHKDELLKHRANDPKGAPRSAGLVIAPDVKAAESAFWYLTNVLGAKAVLVHNEVADAAKILKDFKNSSDEWLVSVAMVSEGVDIPRLKVLAYVTNRQTQLHFVQAVGRVSRFLSMSKGGGETVNLPPLNQLAYVYLPKLPLFEQFASEIEKSVPHNIEPAVDGAVASNALGDRVIDGIVYNANGDFLGFVSPDGTWTGSDGGSYDMQHVGSGQKDAPARVCDNCDGENKPWATVCAHCGTPFPISSTRSQRSVTYLGGKTSGMSFNGRQYTDQHMDDAEVIWLRSPDAYAEYEQYGRVGWTAKKLDDFVSWQLDDGNTFDQAVEQLATVASKRRKAG
jgi:superfamily II DNA or RNA helicase